MGVRTCWSSASEGPGPCWEAVGRDCGGVRATACVSAYCRAGWRSPRSPVRESNRSRWPMSRCGSDSGVYQPLHL